MLTCFMVLINDNDVFYSIIYLDGWTYVAALIFWFLYIILMVFILFNFLIAIIVDAFMDVQVSKALSCVPLRVSMHTCPAHGTPILLPPLLPPSHLLLYLTQLISLNSHPIARLMRSSQGLGTRPLRSTPTLAVSSCPRSCC